MEKKMKSKIEKLVKQISWDYANEGVVGKINEIIDHLNSQDQEEENTVCEGCGKTITSRFMQSYTKGDGMHSYCLSCDPEKQDTPEEKEEWEERFAEFFLYVTNDKNWVDGRPEWKGDVFVTLYNAILHFIEKLLDEKEREAYEKGKEYQASLDRACYGTSFEKLEKGIVDDKDPLAPKKGIDWSSPKEVSKLTTK